MPGSDEWGGSTLSPSCSHDCRGQDVFQVHSSPLSKSPPVPEQLDVLLTFCVDISGSILHLGCKNFKYITHREV